MKDKNGKKIEAGDSVAVSVLGKIKSIDARGARVHVEERTLTFESKDLEKIVTDDNVTDAGQD